MQCKCDGRSIICADRPLMISLYSMVDFSNSSPCSAWAFECCVCMYAHTGTCTCMSCIHTMHVCMVCSDSFVCPSGLFPCQLGCACRLARQSCRLCRAELLLNFLYTGSSSEKRRQSATSENCSWCCSPGWKATLKRQYAQVGLHTSISHSVPITCHTSA